MKKLCDRRGLELKIGAHVLVQQTAGPYGQTRQFKARIESLEPLMPATILATILEGSWTVYGKYGNSYYEPGKRYRLQPTWTEKAGERWAYHEHHDFEHGHETWLELLDSPEYKPLNHD